MTSGVVTVGRKQYVSGLYWENSPTGRVSQAAKEAARQPGNQADFFVTRLGNKQGRVPQFGLAPPTEGFRVGMPSLAGCLANQQPGSWIGAFHLREGTALVIVRDDLVVPDGDVFFLEEGEARDRLFQEMAIGGFQRIYAPEAWGVPGADTMPLSLLLNDRTDVRLRPVSLSMQSKVVLAVTGALVLLLLGVGWHVQQEQAAAEAERMRQVEMQNRMRSKIMNTGPVAVAPNYPPPDRKWEKEPAPLAIISACQNALSQVPIGIAGWRLSGVRCDGRVMSVNWSRYGSFSTPPPESQTNDTGGLASRSITLPLLPARGEEALWDQQSVTKRYLNQNWTGTLTKAPDDPAPLPPPGYHGVWNPPKPPWVKRSFTLTVPVLPWTLPVFLSNVPGLIISSLYLVGTESASNETWTVEGVIYENRR